jgi:gluconate:H+ symporter, GntP family
MSFPVVLSLVLLSIALIVLLTSWLKHNTFLSMFIVSLLLGVVVLPANDVVPIITQGFGDTMKSIGVIIVLGIMIGVLLEKTGATLSMATAILRLTGKNKAGLAIGITGIVTGIPIFCNSGFIMLSGLNKSLVQRSGKPMLYMATMLAAGLYSIHCLIPPHPGAMAAVSLIKPNIGQLIVLGIAIAIPGAVAGFAWARFMCRNEPHAQVDARTDEKLPADEQMLPSTLRSFLPILVPLLLLTAKSVVLLKPAAVDGFFTATINLIGCPEVALLIGVGLAVTLFKTINIKEVSELFDEAIEKAGPILVLTGAGGIFGAVIKATGVGEHAGAYLAVTGLGLTIPFIISAFLKTAQGSSTVAIMTAASIVAPMLTALHLDSDAGRLLATLAMGAGSMVVSHANDSYFWVVAKFSGLEPGPTLRVYTTTTLIMGLSTFLAVWLCSLFML